MAFGQQRGQIAEQEVDVEAAFVRLVNHDGVVAAQLWVALNLREQDAVGDHAQSGIRGAFVGEPHLVADFIAEFRSHFQGDAFGDCSRGKPARLRVHNLVTMRATAHFQQHFRDLRGFARSGLAGDDDDLRAFHRVDDFVMRRGNRQFLWIRELHA